MKIFCLLLLTFFAGCASNKLCCLCHTRNNLGAVATQVGVDAKQTSVNFGSLTSFIAQDTKESPKRIGYFLGMMGDEMNNQWDSTTGNSLFYKTVGRQVRQGGSDTPDNFHVLAKALCLSGD